MAEGRLELASLAYVLGAGGGDDAVAEQLARLPEESALVESGGEVDQHGPDQGRVVDDDGGLAGLEPDLDEWAVAAQGGHESEVVAQEGNRVAQERERARGPGYGGGAMVTVNPFTEMTP